MKLVARMKAAVAPLSSLYGSITSSLTRPVGSPWGWSREPYSGAWQSGAGPQVDPLGALTAYGAVYSCINRIASDISKLQPVLMELHNDATWQPAATQPQALIKPNGFQTRLQFYSHWMTGKLLHGNAYALKIRDERSVVKALYLLDPRKVVPLVTPEGDVYYRINGDDLARIPGGGTVPASEIIHDRINCLWHPLVGISPLCACGISATHGLRIQTNAAQFFGNMSRPSGMLTAPGSIAPETAETIKRTFESNYGAGNLGRLLVMGDGLTYEPMTIPAQDAQLIEQLKWTAEDVARCFGVPLYKINAAQIPGNANVEALHQQYFAETLQVHLEAMEQLLDVGLSVQPGQRVEFDLADLLRTDTKTLYETLNVAVGGGWMAANEARRRVNLSPVAGGETPLAQQQNFSLAALARRDAKPDPFGSSGATKSWKYRYDEAGNVVGVTSE